MKRSFLGFSQNIYPVRILLTSKRLEIVFFLDTHKVGHGLFHLFGVEVVKMVFKKDEELDLVGIINCAGCPTLAGYEKLLERVRALTEFNVDAIHLTYCVDALCPFKAKYKALLEENFPDIEIVVGTHESKLTPEQYREKVKKVLCKPRESMVDIIKQRIK